MTMILLVEDDELVVDVVRAALEPRGYIVAAVDDGAQVRRIVELKRPSLVILDCGLPEVPGIEALRQLRVSEVSYDIPVLVLTGRRSDSDETIAMRAGANDYLRKPFDPDDLVARVEALLEKQRKKYASLADSRHPARSAATRW